MLPPVLILAGGRGTRLGELGATTPKALVEVAGEPFCFHQLRALADAGAHEVVLAVGHFGAAVERAVGVARFGLAISYRYDPVADAGTLGAVRNAAGALGGRFLVLYGDTFLEIDYAAFANDWAASGKAAAMSVVRAASGANVEWHEGALVRYDKARPTPAMDHVDYGLGGLTTAALRRADTAWTDLADLYRELSATGDLFGVEVQRPFHEIGTPDALAATDRFLRARR